MAARIMAMVERIEGHASRALGHEVMAHELAWLAPRLKQWQDDSRKSLSFINFLAKTLDAIAADDFDWSRGLQE